jgi:hypothetical protein
MSLSLVDAVIVTSSIPATSIALRSSSLILGLRPLYLVCVRHAWFFRYPVPAPADQLLVCSMVASVVACRTGSIIDSVASPVSEVNPPFECRGW